MLSNNIPKVPGAFPERVTLELTNRCNLNCTFCPRKYMEKERGFMETDVAMRLIDEMAENGSVSLVPFFRGESMLHPDWFKILSHACAEGINDIQFTTNASLLTRENADKMLSMGLGFISFSLDTTDPELYEKYRKGAQYDVTHENVLYFLKRRDELKVPTQVQVSAVETGDYRPAMQQFVDYWQSKVDRVRIYVEHSAQGNLGGIDEEIPEFERRLPCHKLFTDMIIYWNGEVAICNHDWTRMKSDFRLGNAIKEGIANVWKSEAYQAIRSAHSEGRFTGLGVCESCDHWKMYYLKSGYLGRTYTRA